jgi:hypothetical protein
VSQEWITGGALALVVGILGDILLAAFFQTWQHTQSPNWKTLASATAAMAAILGLLFGGQYSTGHFLNGVDFRPYLEPYVVVLASLMTPVGIFVLVRVLFQVPGHTP